MREPPASALDVPRQPRSRVPGSNARARLGLATLLILGASGCGAAQTTADGPPASAGQRAPRIRPGEGPTPQRPGGGPNRAAPAQGLRSPAALGGADVDVGDDAVEDVDGEAARSRRRAQLPALVGERSQTCQAWQPLAEAAGGRSDVEPLLLLAVAWVESGFVADARSSAGARGPLQLLTATSRAFGCDDPEEPSCAFGAAAAFLARLLDRFDGDVVYALAAYNTGASRVAAAARAGRLPPSHWYVERVLAARALLRLHGCTPPP